MTVICHALRNFRGNELGACLASYCLEGNGDVMKDISKILKTCKWCYQIYLIEDNSVHSLCMKKKDQVVQRRKKSIKYDKTGGRKNDRTITRI